MRNKQLEVTLWSITLVSLTFLGLLAWWGSRQQSIPMQPPRTPVVTDISAVPYDCTAHLTDLATGEEWAVPAPCHRPADGVCVRTGGSGPAFRAWAEPCTLLITTPTPVGCTNSISVRISEDGSVTSWCAGEVNN